VRAAKRTTEEEEGNKGDGGRASPEPPDEQAYAPARWRPAERGGGAIGPRCARSVRFTESTLAHQCSRLPQVPAHITPVIPRPILLLLLCISLTAFAEPPPISEGDLKTVKDDLSSQLTKANADLAITPDSIPLLSTRGDAQLFLAHIPEAVADYEKTIQLDPSQDAPHWRLGIAYYFAEKWEKSSRQFAKYHAYDGHDRENGVWKFFADVHWHGLEKARHEMLSYSQFDREPFPPLYEMLAGKMTPDTFRADQAARKLTTNPSVAFFAEYYGGLYEETLGHHEDALRHVAKAVALFHPADAARRGPGFMWQVARVHYDLLAAKPASK
jgi:lipoprotein NlpI